jgi:hypothetical protein
LANIGGKARRRRRQIGEAASAAAFGGQTLRYSGHLKSIIRRRRPIVTPAPRFQAFLARGEEASANCRISS